MFKSYLKIAYRNLLKNKSYSLINIGGFTLGLTIGILLLIYVKAVLTFDRFHEDADKIFLVYKIRVTPTGEQRSLDTWVPLLAELRSTFPSIVDGTRYISVNEQWVGYDDNQHKESISFADPSFFDVFTFPLVSGKADFGSQKRSIVISKNAVIKYFGSEDPIGKTLTIGLNTDFIVTGVLDDIPSNSSLNFDFLVPLENILRNRSPDQVDWDTSFLLTYVKLRDKKDISKLEAQFPDLITKIWDAETESRTEFKAVSLPDFRNLDTNGATNRYGYTLFIFAISLLLIAAINFMNLSTARSLHRAKEIGMRKVIGAQRSQLIIQFLGESSIITFGSLILAIFFVKLLLPVLNDLANMELQFNLLSDPFMLLMVILTGLLIGLFAGSYPAIFQSGFGLVESLQGSFHPSSKRGKLRNYLVLTQFLMTAIFVTVTFAGWKQVNYIKNADLHFDRNNVVALRINRNDFETHETALQKQQQLKTELQSMPEILAISSSSSVPGIYNNEFTFVRPQGWNRQTYMRVRWAPVDEHYFELMGIEFKEGSNFDPQQSGESGRAVIINETMLKEMKWNSSQGRFIDRGGEIYNVVGVTEDFNYEALHSPVRPVAHAFSKETSPNHKFILLKLNSYSDEVLEMIDQKWQALDPPGNIEIISLPEVIDDLYVNDENLSKIFQYATVISFIIAGLGLLGLVSYSIVQKRKEFGIRKVIGAAPGNITMLLFVYFGKPILMANILSWPVSYFLLSGWLKTYAFRIAFPLDSLVYSSLFVLIVSLVIVSFQSVRAALENPVQALNQN